MTQEQHGDLNICSRGASQNTVNNVGRNRVDTVVFHVVEMAGSCRAYPIPLLRTGRNRNGPTSVLVPLVRKALLVMQGDFVQQHTKPGTDCKGWNIFRAEDTFLSRKRPVAWLTRSV